MSIGCWSCPASAGLASRGVRLHRPDLVDETALTCDREPEQMETVAFAAVVAGALALAIWRGVALYTYTFRKKGRSLPPAM